MGEIRWASESGIDLDDYYAYNYNNYNKKDCIDDAADDIFGDGLKDYEAYVLCDGTKPGNFKYGLLQFPWEPFYVGHGKIKRSKKSSWISMEQYAYPTNFKDKRIKEISIKKGYIHIEIIGYYETKRKARIVEKKLMNLIPNLTNMLYHYCDLELHKEDCEYHKFITDLRIKASNRD